MSCGVCDTRRPLLCPSCFTAASAGRYADVRALTEQRDAAHAALSGLVADKEEHQQQQLALLRLGEDTRRMQVRAAEAERAAAALRHRVAATAADLQLRQARLAEAQQQLALLRQQANASLAGQQEQQAHAYLRSLKALAREQRTRVVRRAMQILPLTFVPPARSAQSTPSSGSGSDGAGSAGAPGGAGTERAAAMICALQLPDSRGGMAELAVMSSTLGSALGHLALLLDLLGRLLQLPVPHRCAFQGSTSRLWQPDGFFDMRATPPNDALLLAWPKGLEDSGGGLGGSLGVGGGGAAAQHRARQEQQLRAALHQLQRSVGTLVFARLGPDAALKVPPDWPPFTWLAGLCKVLAAEPRSASSRISVPGASPAASAAAASAAAARSLAASTVFGRYSPENGGMAQSVLFHDGGADDEPEEDWEHLPRPAYGMIPPPPSQPEDVEHWVAAMYGESGGGTNGGGAPAAAAASFGTSPMARLRALTRAYLGALPLSGGGG